MAAYDLAGFDVDNADPRDAEACTRALKRWDEARDALAEAFAADTADRNRHEDVLGLFQCLMGERFVRRLLAPI